MGEAQAKKTLLTKQKILAAAELEFSEKGIFGARIDSIAESAGVNKRMIYEHYTNKEELYKRVLEEVYGRLAEYEKSYYVEGISPELAIRNIVYGSFRFLESNPSFVRILMWENLNNASYLEKNEIAAIKAPTIDYIKEQIGRGKEKGIFREDADEMQIVISLMNFEFSYFSNMYTLSGVLGVNLSDSLEISKRALFVSDMIIKYLKK